MRRVLFALLVLALATPVYGGKKHHNNPNPACSGYSYCPPYEGDKDDADALAIVSAGLFAWWLTRRHNKRKKQLTSPPSITQLQHEKPIR